MEPAHRVSLLQCAPLPALYRLVLCGHAGRKADKAIRVAKMRPGFLDGPGILPAVMSLRAPPELLLHAGPRRAGSGQARLPGIGGANQVRVQPAATRGKVKRAVVSDYAVGYWKWDARKECFHRALVRAAAGMQRHIVNGAKASVKDEQAAPIARRERCPGPGKDARRRTLADVNDARKVVRSSIRAT